MYSANNQKLIHVPNELRSPPSQIQLQPMVENIRDKLAENIHEMWAVSKIESGWQFGEGGRLDEEMMLHPCLTQFQTLPQAEKRYNIQLAIQTLRQVHSFSSNFLERSKI